MTVELEGERSPADIGGAWEEALRVLEAENALLRKQLQQSAETVRRLRAEAAASNLLAAAAVRKAEECMDACIGLLGERAAGPEPEGPPPH